MNRTASTLLLALSLALAAPLAGCSTFRAFTQETRIEHALGAKDLEKLQFYASDTIVLRREIPSGERRVTDGHKLVVVNGRTIEEVTIPAKTPGVVVGVEDGALLVSFEHGTSLRFVAVPLRSDRPSIGFAEPPNGPDPFPGARSDAAGRRAADFSGVYALDVGPGGTVRFQGRDFEAGADTAKVHLEIKAEVLDKKVENKKVLNGIRL